MDLTIVVASRDTPDHLEACLAALARARSEAPQLDFEVIVVDDGSRDDSARRAAASPVTPRLVAGLEARGFASTMNRGLRMARGRHALLLNSDARVDGALLAAAVAMLDADPKIAVLGPALCHADGRPQRSVHRPPSLATEMLSASVADGVERLVAKLGWPGADPRAGRTEAGAPSDVPAVRGAVFFIGAAALEKLGLLDEGYFFFLEETDYCLRARRAGDRVVFAPALVATHALGASSKARDALATRVEYHRSLERFLRRHRGRGVARLAMAWRALRQTIALPFQALAGAVTGRRRFAERAGLVLWHLRGRPAEPSLADTPGER